MPTWSTSTRGSRSAITPPNSRNSTSGIELAASTAPSAVGESETSSTANATATGAIVDPPVFTVWEKKYHRKFCWRSGASVVPRSMPVNLTGELPG